MKTVRTDDTGKLRRKLDEVFSKYIRAKSKTCFTCPSKADHCGHFMKRGNDATRWLESNARPQCWNCNILLAGNWEVFRKNLVVEIGEDAVNDIQELSRLAVKFDANDLQEMINKFS